MSQLCEKDAFSPVYISPLMRQSRHCYITVSYVLMTQCILGLCVMVAHTSLLSTLCPLSPSPLAEALPHITSGKVRPHHTSSPFLLFED